MEQLPDPQDDATLAREFEAGRIPHEDWDHRTHLRLAHYYLTRHPFPAALEHMRAGLKHYLSAQGITETATRGFHETMTQLWMRLVAALLAGHADERTKSSPAKGASATGGLNSEEFLELNPFLLDKSLWRMFYSRRRLVSMQAKAEFVPPDITPLPEFDDARIPRFG